MAKSLHEILHDLKSPLMSIDGFAHLLLEDRDADSVQKRKYVERILANVKVMHDLIEEIRQTGP